MKVRLICDKSEELNIINELKDIVEFTSDGDYILIEKSLFEDKNKILLGYHNDGYTVLDYKQVLYFESFKDSVYAYTDSNVYLLKEKLYELEIKFSQDKFLRVNKSYILNIRKVKKIKPHINRKFIIIMDNGFIIDVTRTYYLIFKEYMGL